MLRLTWGLSILSAGALVADVLTSSEPKLEDLTLAAAAAGWVGLALLARRRVAPLALALVSAGLTLVLIEAGLALRTSGARPFPYYVWPPKYRCKLEPTGLPGVSESGVFSTNSLGMRGPEPGPGYRVLCIGGSTTECLYLDDTLTWPRRAAADLEARHRPAWVANVGRSGTTTVDHVTLVRSLPEARTMDCWVVLCGINDAGYQLSGEYAEFAEHSFERTFAYRRPGFTPPLRRPLYRNTRLFEGLRRLRRSVERVRDPGSMVVFQDRRAVWIDELRQRRKPARRVDELPPLDAFLEEYEGRLRELVAESRRFGVRLVLLTQPTLWAPGMPPEVDALTVFGRLPDGRYLSGGALARCMQAFNQRLLAVGEREGVEVLDLAAELPRSTEVFYDDCHLNEEGARRVGASVAALLAQGIDDPR